MKYKTIKEAAHEWVETFNAIPMSAIRKINEYDLERTGTETIVEITPPAKGDSIYVFSGEYAGKTGEIIKTNKEEDLLYEVEFDSDPNNVYTVDSNSFEVTRYDPLPMWGTMWALTDPVDVEWATGTYLGPNLKKIAECGFRIYESEDFGILLGIDGAGYDFYESHWIPLYKARGLHWHEEE